MTAVYGSVAMTPEERHCLQRLERHADQLSKLLQIMGGANFVAGRDDEVVGTFYGSVKRGLKDEADVCADKGRGLSKPERIWLLPAVTDAYVALQASSNGPIRREVYQQVVTAHKTVHEALVELKRRVEHEGGYR